MKKFRLLFILFILLIPCKVNAKLNYYYSNGAWVSDGGNPSDGTYCHGTGDNWLCYEKDGVLFHCMDRGFYSPAYSNLNVGGYITDEEIIKIANDNGGLTPEAVTSIRNLREQRRNNGSTNLAQTYYNNISNIKTLSNTSSDFDVEAKITWTEDLNWEDDKINSRYYKRTFSKKFHLNIDISGDTTDVSIEYSVTVSGGKAFKLEGNTSGKVGTNISEDIIVYSDEMIDASKVTLLAKVTATKSSKAYKYANRGVDANTGTGQYFIGQVEDIKVPKEFAESISFDVTKTCQYYIDDNDVPHYILHIVNPNGKVEKREVDPDVYMSKGCCADVQPKYFNTTTDDGIEAIEYYRAYCQTQDLVSYENECGTDSCNADKEYKSYSESFVWQVPMDTLKENILKNTKFDDINTKNEQLKHYYNDSLGNKYCKVITSEENTIKFPTTAVATSGRFFVFQELNKNKCDLSTLNYNSKNCFRQPYVYGKIKLYVLTDYDNWSKELAAADEKMKAACSNVNNTTADGLTNGVECNNATNKYNEILNAESDCETKINGFTYDLEPTITFYYEQNMANSTSVTTKEVKMYATKNTDEPVKYWPNVSTDTVKLENKSYDFKQGTYEISYEKTVYYRPESYTYSLLPSGKVKTDSFKSTSTKLENNVLVGYIYNVNLTTYEGVYNTWFDISNLGNGGEDSLLNKYTIEEYKEASKKDYGNEEEKMFKSQCKYCVEEGAFQRECSTCDDLEPKFVFRNVSLSNITPNAEEGDRKNEGTNWVDDKGNAAKSDIESASGNGIAVADIKDSDKELLNNNTLESNEKSNIVFTANEGNTNYIYANDAKYLEYDITLTSVDMRKIRKNNKNISYDYAEINVCNELSTTSVTKDDSEYCYTCNEDGKECESSFITAYTGNNDSKAPGRKKWKYYFYNPDNPEESTFITGTMASGKVLAALKKIQGNEDGGYPDPENQEGWLNTYKNWP
jgi:hypothetical protein